MQKNANWMAKFTGLAIIHQKIPSHEVGRHSHDEHEFFLPFQGDISVQYNGKEAKAGPGRMLYVPPKLDHSFSSTAQGSGERVILLVDDSLWKKHCRDKIEPTATSASGLVKEIVFYLLLNPKVQGSKYFISALVEALADSVTAGNKITETKHLSGKISDRRIQKVVDLLTSDEGKEKNLEEIASESGLSLRNFNRLFLQETGITPKDFIIQKRIEMAKKLLHETQLTVTDISLEVGYNSLSKFIAAFKKIEGILPSDFRANFILK